MLRADYDSPWKEVLECFFKPFVEFCLPDVAVEIDWSKDFVSLNKELIAITRGSKTGKQTVDKLIKVYQKNDKELLVLVHIEIQAQKQTNFPERMVIYNHRIFDVKRIPVASIAILADDNTKWRPSLYERKAWRTKLSFEFGVIKLLDYKGQEEELKKDPNPFALVILAHLKALETSKNQIDRLSVKVALTELLYDRGFNKQYVVNLLRFIDWIMALPVELEIEYIKTITQYEEKKEMAAYVTSFERFGMQRGLEQGVEKGERAILLRQLQYRFGQLPDSYKKRLDQATASEMLIWSERLLEQGTLEEIFK